jgi:integrase
MGRRPSGAIPVPRFHKQSGQARLRFNGREFRFGPFGSAEAERRYQSWRAKQFGDQLAEPPSGNAAPPPCSAVPPAPTPTAGLTVGELWEAWANSIRRKRPDDYKKSSAWHAAKAALRALMLVPGTVEMPAETFGPRRLIEVRDALCHAPIVRRLRNGKLSAPKTRTRRDVNDTAGRIVQMFRWATPMELVPEAKAHALATVKPLAAGEVSAVRDSAPRSPVDNQRLDAILPYLTDPMRAMVLFARLTASRPGEVSRLRLADVINRDQPVWLYRPPQHKNRWRGHDRSIEVGTKAQAVLLEALGGRGEDEYVFSPRRAAPRRPRRPGTIQMHPPKPSPRAGEYYTTAAIRRAIARACKQAGVPAFPTYELRYTRIDEVRRLHGPDAAQRTAGHRTRDLVDHYAPVGREEAMRAALLSG